MKSLLFFWLTPKFKSRKFFYSHLLIAATIIAGENFQFAKPAQAQASLSCNNIYVSVKSGSPTNTYPTGQQIHQLDWTNGTLGLQIGSNITGVTGGIGINPTSKLIYYIDGNGGSGYGSPAVGRIYSFDGSSSSAILNTIANPTTEHQVGIDLSGVLWTTKYNADKYLYSYTPSTNTVSAKGSITAASNGTEWTALAEGDFAFDKNDQMWFVSTYNSQIAIWTINRTTRAATRVGNYGSITGTNHVVTGGAFGPDGKLYIGTSFGHIYKFDTTASTLATVSTTTGSTITDMASCMYPPISISGNVWRDQDNSAQNTFTNIKTGSEIGTNGGGLNAFLIDANNKVIASSVVNTNGGYSFPKISGNQSGLRIRLSTTSANVGTTAPTASLPSNWINTTPLEISNLNAGTSNITNQDFGIEQLPNTTALNPPSQTNPGGTTQVQVATLAGIDLEDGPLGSGKKFKIITLPTNGTLYYGSTAVTAGQTISAYDPTLLKLDPNDGTLTVSFTYASVDAAGQEDPTPATVSMAFTIPDNGPFSSCPAPAYISQGASNNAVKLYSVDLSGGGLSAISTDNIPNGINGIGFNQKDGYIYGMNTSSTNAKLLRLDKTGVATELGTVTGLPMVVTMLVMLILMVCCMWLWAILQQFMVLILPPSLQII
ncbi:MAG: hypothetical protein HC930_07900 [Hydrococcus sp. SU_1_0]|nr:hypothetical protein [Hydrococcus sp. SU_1_0]